MNSSRFVYIVRGQHSSSSNSLFSKTAKIGWFSLRNCLHKNGQKIWPKLKAMVFMGSLRKLREIPPFTHHLMISQTRNLISRKRQQFLLPFSFIFLKTLSREIGEKRLVIPRWKDTISSPAGLTEHSFELRISFVCNCVQIESEWNAGNPESSCNCKSIGHTTRYVLGRDKTKF